MCACVCVLGRCGAFLLFLTKSRASSAQRFCSFPAWIPCAAARPARWEHSLLGCPGLAGFWQKAKLRTFCSGTGFKTFSPSSVTAHSQNQPQRLRVALLPCLPPRPLPGALVALPLRSGPSAARVGSQQQLGVRLTCPASSSAMPRSIQRGFASLSSRGRFPGLFGRGPVTRRVVAFQAEQKILGNVQPRGKECPSLHPSLFCLASADFQKERIVFFYFSSNAWKRCWGPFFESSQ